MRKAFERSEYQARLDRLQERMDELGLEAMLVSAPENIFYLSGYQTKAVFTLQFVLVRRTGLPFLFTRQMEIANAERALKDGLLDSFAVYQDDEDPLEASAKLVAARVGAGSRIGAELGSWTMPAARAETLRRVCDRLEWSDCTGLVDRMRLVKSPAELAVMQEAAGHTAAIAAKAMETIAPGRTENDVTQAVMAEMIACGSEYPGSWPNVMAGPRTGLIHAAWEGAAIVPNDHVLAELTGVAHRYHAPCLRTVMVGEPRGEISRAADAMLQAHDAAVAAMAPGRPMSVINEAAQTILQGNDVGCRMAKRSGYSLGIGFPPSWGAQWQIGLNSVVTQSLEVGMTFHIVLVGHFPDGRAIGIGETVALLDSGPARLTQGGFFNVR
jgi:Xaa-Pro dipeptidase